MRMPSQEERDAARAKLKQNRERYNTLIEHRMAGTLRARDFMTRSTLLEKEGAKLRNIIGLNTLGVGGVYCHGCGQFFLGPDIRENVESFESCKRHRAYRITQVTHPAHA